MTKRPPRDRTPPDSRTRVLAAAAAEFAARGYAGANVDRIARAARLNKAMIYYHFGSKAALYREILRDMFGEVERRVTAVAGAPLPADAKIRGFVDAIAQAAAERPHFPPIWLRELTEGAQHVDTATLKYAKNVLGLLGRIIAEGCATGQFKPANPMLVHAGIIAPLMFFFVTEGVRAKFERAGVPEVGTITREAVIAHVQGLALAVLEGRLA